MEKQHIFDRVGRVSARELENVSVQRWLPPTIGKAGHLVFAEPRDLPAREQESAASPPAQQPRDSEAMTQAAREEARREGYQEGLAAGRQEGLALGRTEGFEQGLAEGMAEAQQQISRQLETQLVELNKLLTSITFAMNEQDYQLELAIMNLVREVARAVVGRELASDSGHIMKIVRTALAALPPTHDNVRIVVNPHDLPLLQQAIENGGENWRAAGSEEVEAGGCRIHTDQSLVDFTTGTRFRTMMEQIVARQLSAPLDEALESAPEPVIKPFAENGEP